MEVPKEIFEKELTAAEFKVISAMYRLADRSGVVDASMEDIGVWTKYKREMIRRCVRSLESHGLITTRRKRRNFNKYHGNVYQLILAVESPNLCLQSEALDPVQEPVMEKTQCLQSEASTHDCIAVNRLTTSSVINTSYLLQVREAHNEPKEVLVGNWKKNWDDDNLGSVGLFDEELLEKVEPQKINKRDPRTRSQRPDYEWTPQDTAAELGVKLRQRFPELPPLINTRNLSIVLAKYRKDLGTTALVELELIKMFLADEKNLSYVARNPQKALGAFLTTFKTRLSDAMERLNLSAPTRSTDNDVDIDSDFLYATDGTRFENTLVGRKAFERYTERMAQTP